VKVRAVAAAAILVLGGGSLLYVHHRDELRPLPVFATVPTTVPATDVRRSGRARICQVHFALPEPFDGRGIDGHLWVGPDPDGGVALWLPGMNASPCRARLTHLSVARATAFADAVERSQPVPAGTYNCPADDGAAVDVYLTYAGQDRAEVIEVPLGGCGWIGAPGRDDREAWDVWDALRPMPKGFALGS